MKADKKPIDRAALLKLASGASVVTAGVLIVAKLAAYAVTGSVSLLASLVDSVMDSFASLINLFAIRYSLQPPDEQHRFGHGKAEPLAGLAQAAFIAGSAIFLVFHAIDRLRFRHELEQVGIGVVVMVVAIVLTMVLLAIQRYVIRRTGSTAIRADSLHYLTDALPVDPWPDLGGPRVCHRGCHLYFLQRLPDRTRCLSATDGPAVAR